MIYSHCIADHGEITRSVRSLAPVLNAPIPERAQFWCVRDLMG